MRDKGGWARGVRVCVYVSFGSATGGVVVVVVVVVVMVVVVVVRVCVCVCVCVVFNVVALRVLFVYRFCH